MTRLQHVLPRRLSRERPSWLPHNVISDIIGWSILLTTVAVGAIPLAAGWYLASTIFPFLWS